jgi:hypothetical protein
LLACTAALMGFGAVLLLATHNDYGWVELDGQQLRAQHLYTRQIVERSIHEIESLGTMVLQVRRLETVITEKLLGRVKGVEIRFRDRRTPLRIMRADPAMTNAQALIEAVLYRMSETGPLEAEVVNFAGQPLVRNIHWKGEQPSPPPSKNRKVVLGCLMGMALVFGAILTFLGRQQEELQVLGSVPPHEITISSLLQNGPGTNRHITLTGFTPGGYVYETQGQTWTQVWIALFPAGAQPGEIKAVLSSTTVPDEPALRRLLQPGRVTGICSAAPRSGWGTTLGPELEKSNPGQRLVLAWSIEELRKPPSAQQVKIIFAGAAVCLAATCILALAVCWRGG